MSQIFARYILRLEEILDLHYIQIPGTNAFNVILKHITHIWSYKTGRTRKANVEREKLHE